MDLPDDPRLTVGATLREKWRLDAVLGRGGMATVFAATHRNGTRAAVKVLHAELARDPAVRRRFLREGYVANKIDHPGVVRVIDDDVTDDGLVYLVMELLEGETAKQRWLARGRKLPAEEVLDIGEGVLDILARAHAAEVVHRDVKPDNIFLAGAAIKLLDFGIARIREGTAEATQTGAMLGTPAFMSPEQALAHWGKVDVRSDLFSLGATIWLLLTGKLVHQASTVPELLVAMATRPAPPLEGVLPGAPLELRRLVDRALAFERADRWSSASAMGAALVEARQALAGKVLEVPTMVSGTSAEVAPAPRGPLEIWAAGPIAQDEQKTAAAVENAATTATAGRPAPRSLPAVAALAVAAGGVAFGAWALLRPPSPVDLALETTAAMSTGGSSSGAPTASESAPPAPTSAPTDAPTVSAAPPAPSGGRPVASPATRSTLKKQTCKTHKDCDWNGYCQDGRCRCSGDDRAVCDGTCVRLSSTRSHCGKCGVACGSEAACVKGRCVECEPPLRRCGDRCVGTLVDGSNCGGCGVVCPSTEPVCVLGKCRR